MIELRSLTKKYGSFTAVDSIDLSVPDGELFGFLGPNGAGKTTTLRMIAGILQPTSGSIHLAGIDLAQDPLAAKSKLGFIPDRPFIYEKLTGAEFLRFVAGLYGQDGDKVEHRGRELMALFDLEEWADELVESYSHGMRQKLIISSAFVHRPEEIGVAGPTSRSVVGATPRVTASPSLRHVLSPKFLSAKARPLGKTENQAGRLILFGVIGAVFWLFVFGMLYRLLKYFRGIPEIGALLAAKLLGLMFVSLFGILILSDVVTALSSFFLAEDLDLLVAAPVDWLRLYGAKLLETTAHSSWMVVLVATPVLTAYGIIYQGGFLYPLIAIAAGLPFLFIPAAIGTAVTLVLVNIFPARRTRDILSVIAVLAAAGVVLLFRLVRPERLARPEGFRSLVEFISLLRTPTSSWMPSEWVAQGIMTWLRGDPEILHFYLLWSTAAVVVVFGAILHRWLYARGFSKSQETGQRWVRRRPLGDDEGCVLTPLGLVRRV